MMSRHLSEIKNERGLRKLIWKNCEELRQEIGATDVEILHEGVTGGRWPDFTIAHCEKREQSNAALFIKRHGMWDEDAEEYMLVGCYIVTGAGVGGSRGHFAKQKEYVVAYPIY